ncbi:MAG: YjjG family noncanonical pyrimidine nucleotidase [Anaerolineae bacterium]
MTYRWALFDADGTLFDYDAAEYQALSRSLTQVGLPFGPDVLERYRQINSQLWHDFEKARITSDRIKAERFIRFFEELSLDQPAPDPLQFSTRYLQNLGDCVDLIPGAAEVLRDLRGKVRLALITNGLSDVQRSRLSKSGLEGYFEAVVISEEEGVAKPDPGIFDIIFARMNHPDKREVLMIGDSLTSDIRGANAYGIDACWYNPNGLPRDVDVAIHYEIRALSELLSIVEL